MKVNHKELVKWVLEMAKMCNPDRIVWIDGSEKTEKTAGKRRV